LEQFAKLAHLRRAELCSPLSLDVGDHVACDGVDGATAGGGADELGAAVGGVGNAFDVAVLLQVRDELGHRLLGDLGACCELAHSGAVVVEEGEDIAVGRADRCVSSFGDTPVQFLVADPVRLTQEEAEVDAGGPI
jgi:hypothetical protein